MWAPIAWCVLLTAGAWRLCGRMWRASTTDRKRGLAVLGMGGIWVGVLSAWGLVLAGIVCLVLGAVFLWLMWKMLEWGIKAVLGMVVLARWS